MPTIRTLPNWGYTAAVDSNRDKEPENRPEPRGAAPRQESWPRGDGRGPRAGVMAPRRGLWPLGRGSWPQRKPGRKSDFGVSFESSSGLPRRSIVNFVQLRPKLTILRRLKAKTHDYLRHRKAHARTTDKNVHFSLPRPRKTVVFDRQRPKTTVFRIAHLRVRIMVPRAGVMALQGGAGRGIAAGKPPRTGRRGPGRRSWPLSAR